MNAAEYLDTNINNYWCDVHICVHTICTVYDLWKGGYTHLKSIKINSPPCLHSGIQNRNAAKGKEDAYNSLHQYFAELKDQVDPLFAKFVHGAAEMEMQGEQDTVCLPCHYSKEMFFKKRCFCQGYIATFKNSGTNDIDEVKNWKIWPNDNDTRPLGSEPKTVILLRSFKRFWKANYNNIKI